MPVTKSGSGIAPGTVAHFAASTAPAGWLKANGATVSRTTYAALFTAIGTTYGAGDGSTTFALPDLRGEFLRGLDDGRGVDTGRGIGTAQSDQNKEHTHQMQVYRYTTQSLGGNQPIAVGTATAAPIQAATPMWMDADESNTIGRARVKLGGGAEENRPRNVAALACIKF